MSLFHSKLIFLNALSLFPSLFRFPKRLEFKSVGIIYFQPSLRFPVGFNPLEFIFLFIFYFRVYFVFLNALSPREFIFRFIFFISRRIYVYFSVPFIFRFIFFYFPCVPFLTLFFFFLFRDSNPKPRELFHTFIPQTQTRRLGHGPE